LTKAFLQCVYIQAVFIVYSTYSQAIIADLSIWRFGDLSIWRFGGLAVWGFGDLPICRFADLLICKFAKNSCLFKNYSYICAIFIKTKN